MRYGLIAATIVTLAGAAALAQTPPPAPLTPPPPPSQAANGTTIAPHPLTSFVPVSAATLKAPDPDDWLMVRGNYQGWGFSKLTQIDRSNVKGLQLVWARTMAPGINEAAPLIYKGVMFLGNPDDVIQAIDAKSGSLLWEYRRSLPTLEAMHFNHWGERKRSVFLWGDKLYTSTRDNHIVALDAKTGKVVWDTDRGGGLYATNTNGPIVVDGVVITGATCQEAAFGCYVTGHDAVTGKELWRNTLIPKPGEKGDETWGGMPFDQRWETGVWGPITYDPDTNLAFYGSSGMGPSSDAQRGVKGVATLAGTNTRYAIDPRTGKIAWQHQVLPQDNWDQECTFEMMPITTKVAPDPKASGMMAIGAKAGAASRRTLTGVPCKTSIMWSFDETKGDFLWAKSTVFQNLVNGIDNKGKVTVNPDQLMTDIHKTYHQCPTHAGGRDWPFAAYSPQTNVMYVELQNFCADYRVRYENIPSKPRDQYNTLGKPLISDGSTNIGRLDAISVETGKTLWSWETEASNYSPVLATAGGLLFNGTMDRYFRAFDQANGKVLWQTRLGSQVFGTPVTFRVDGRQYIAVAAGGGYNSYSPTLRPDLDQVSGGNMVYVFALPEYRMKFAALSFALVCAAGAAQAAELPFAKERIEWDKPFKPFRIIDNIYFVGTRGVAAFLITTPKGDILTDGTLAETAHQVEANIKALGFSIKDVKVLLNSHAHFDHSGGLAKLKADSGAAFYASAGDRPYLESGHIPFGPSSQIDTTPIHVDHVVGEGDTVKLDGVTLTAHMTPGHTPGCTTYTMPIVDHGKPLTVMFFCSISVAGNPLVDNKAHPTIAQEYKSSFAKLSKMHADVFLGPHGGQFHMEEKVAAMKPGSPNPFIDLTELPRYLAQAKKDYDAELAKQYAARGGYTRP